MAEKIGKKNSFKILTKKMAEKFGKKWLKIFSKDGYKILARKMAENFG